MKRSGGMTVRVFVCCCIGDGLESKVLSEAMESTELEASLCNRCAFARSTELTGSIPA